MAACFSGMMQEKGAFWRKAKVHVPPGFLKSLKASVLEKRNGPHSIFSKYGGAV
jgi:hypothetical protein